ncbi:ABC transporter substrate-binding protein [Solidesulfovibrio magneticus]|uniref:ABC transporter substrate binding protein n=1 Tax=Solidesulfovibrio magneticus (strain ATCC 700980 / DSM 13731 / RS-1) TaxID=573370 RepID=C4XTI1_SOLM1|nr:ABC transporter substrate binding protein [Solidesulfovibrio magneticus]BAH75978.1 hypothetical protein DMR_24870 [Solidesulfovibrio magneticus RS-1]
MFSLLKSFIILFCFVVSCLSGLGVAHGVAAGPYRIAIVHSYGEEYVWTKNITEGILEALRGVEVSYDIYYLDAKNNPSPEFLRKRSLEIFDKIVQNNVQLVVAVDDPAQVYLVVPYLKDKDGPKVVFCGVNAPLSQYGYPSVNVTGVQERWHFREGFALMAKFLPWVKSVAVLVDSSESAGYVLADLQREREVGGVFPLEVLGVEQASTFQQWQSLVRHYHDRVDVLALGLYHSLKDENTNKVVPPELVSDWNNSNVTKPTLGFTDFSKDHGHLAGVLESGHEQGFLAGKLAYQVLVDKIAPASLPIQLNQRGIVFLNLKTAARLGINLPYEFIEASEVVIQ